MLNYLRPAFTLLVAMTLLTGIAYPLTVTGIAQAVMPENANGSLIEKDGAVIGSRLIGQNFTSNRYFWPRPSATGPEPYNAAGSSGSNLGTTSAVLRGRVKADIERLRAAGLTGNLPADAVMASGSGLDPHISPAFAVAQASRVARARGLAEAEVLALVGRLTQEPQFGLIGEPRVNVLQLNLALDALKT